MTRATLLILLVLIALPARALKPVEPDDPVLLFLENSTLPPYVRVISGDTFVLRDRVVQLNGIDAWELEQRCPWEDRVVRCGIRAAVFLVQMLNRVFDRPDLRLSCQYKGAQTDSTVSIGTCHILYNDGRGAEDIAVELLKVCYAVPTPWLARYYPNHRYIKIWRRATEDKLHPMCKYADQAVKPWNSPYHRTRYNHRQRPP